MLKVNSNATGLEYFTPIWPDVSWGNPTSQYSPLTINSVTRNLSLDGHTHSYLPLSGGNLTGALTISGNKVWHAGNDGAGSGLDADLLRGVAPSNLAVLSATKLANTRTIWGQSFNGEGDVSGSINNATTGAFSSYVAAQRFYTGFDAGIAGSVSCSNWFRSSGESGWYSETYGAGINSDTANVVRTYSANKFKVYNAEADSITTYGGIFAYNWFRSNGDSGWYNQTYGGGIHMEDSTYVRIYNYKSLWVDNNIVATGEVTAYSASDVRLKTDVTTLKDSLRIIELLNPVSYKWNSLAKELNPLKDNNTDYGLIAQELETVMPELVHSIYDGKYKSIDYVKIIPHLICAIKQLKMEVDHLKS